MNQRLIKSYFSCIPVLLKEYLSYISKNTIEYIQIIFLLSMIYSLLSFHLIAFIIFLILYCAFPLTIKEKPTNLASDFDTPMQKKISESLEKNMKEYSLPMWMSSGIMQTMISGALKFKTPILEFDRQLVDSPDGGYFAIDWSKNQDHLSENSPVIVILHGLAGGCREPYIQRFVYYAMEEGFRCCVITNRGCAGMKMRTPKAYNSAFFDDAIQSLTIIHEKYPNAPINLIGFSLGANTCLGLSSRKTELLKELNVTCSVGISPSPWLISMMLSLCPALDETFSQFELRLVKKNVEVFQQAYDRGDFYQDMKLIYCCKSMKQFDDAFTSKNFDYGQKQLYYFDIEQVYHFMKNSIIPTFTLNAMDDPVAIMTQGLSRRFRNMASVSPFYVPLVSQTGGHLSWTFKPGHKGYYDDLVLGFMKQMNEMFVSGELEKLQNEYLEKMKK